MLRRTRLHSSQPGHRHRLFDAEQLRLKTLKLLKARQDGAAPQFRAGPREIAQVARVMHDRMVELNEGRQTVLAESICCGWLAWRPDEAGKLVPVSDQAWAAPFPLPSSRLEKRHLGNRRSFLDEAGKPTILDEEAVLPGQLQHNYF